MSRAKKQANPTEEAQASQPVPEVPQAAQPQEEGALAQLNELQAQLEQTSAKANEYFDGWQRERADFSNYKRRMERDQVQLSQTLTGTIIKKYLAVMDDLERALKARPSQGEGAAWADGIELIYRKLEKLLEAEGVQRIPAETEVFDPARHEAITHEDHPDFESGQIIEVVQQGYLIGERVLRPALVRVAR